MDPRKLQLNIPHVRVYIAGPYTQGDVAANVAMAMDAADRIIGLGYGYFCPHLAHFMHMHNPHPYSVWMEQDLAWLPFCHALFRLPGDSDGADLECEAARELGKPVFTTFEELDAHFKKATAVEDEP